MTTNELIDLHMGLIKKIASKFYNTEREDLIQVGIIGLLKAYQNFNAQDNTSFSTYAYYYIYGEMYNLVKSSQNIKVSKIPILFPCVKHFIIVKTTIKYI